jgi:hypothetical protein
MKRLNEAFTRLGNKVLTVHRSKVVLAAGSISCLGYMASTLGVAIHNPGSSFSEGFQRYCAVEIYGSFLS